MNVQDRVTEMRLVPADQLIANPANWRRHPQAQQRALAAVLDEVGFAGAVIAREDEDGGLVIIDGHARAEMVGEATVPVLVTDLTEAEADVVLATYDPIGAMAQKDHEAFATLAARIDTANETLLGLLDRTKDGETDPDDVPNVLTEPKSKLGEVYELGPHRVMCGDATSEDDHDEVLAGAKPDLVLTDPPYGVGIEYGQFEDTPEAVLALLPKFLALVRRWPVVLITSGVRLLWDYPRPDWILAWVHPAGMGSGPWGFTMLNPVLVYGKDPYLRDRKGGRPDTIVMAAERQGIEGHPVPKPAAVWRWFVERGSTQVGDKVFDPFLGSGTTLIAAEQTGRTCYGMEIDPRYVDVIRQRYADFVGDPRLAPNG